VSFDVDANGILNVSAAEKSTGKSNKITITNDKGRLSKEEVERLVEEAAKHAEEDKAAMARVEAKNELEAYLYNSRNSLKEEKVKEKLGSEAEAALKTVDEGLEWLGENDSASTEEYKGKMKEYEEKIRPVMMKLYAGEGSPEGMMPGMMGQPSGGAPAPAPAPAPGPKVEEVD
jgi:L1 cell adhesion molecule like protein